MKVVTVVGARPQFVKAAVVSRVFAAHDEVKEILVHTGQHFDANMSDVFFEEMSIPKPQYNLNVNGLSHGAMTGQMLEKIEEVLMKENPDWVLVYGDTNSTLAGSLAAKKLHIRVAHVEAGLRSFNMQMPEEINRILTDRISDVLFCPTDVAIRNLKREGFDYFPSQIVKNGDVMQDAAVFYSTKAQKPVFDLPEKFVICTLHRAENTDDKERLSEIISALEDISRKCVVVLPLHPRTRAKLADVNFDFQKSSIRFINPVGYLEMVWLLKHCSIVMTDSGGLQKEAYFFGKYCITLRDETEWVELVDNHFNILSGSDRGRILYSYDHLSDNMKGNFENRLYGNGDAGEKVFMTLIQA